MPVVLALARYTVVYRYAEHRVSANTRDARIWSFRQRLFSHKMALYPM